ncbi:MAG TPA: LysE family transporter [Dongiaceae bacterium]|nr:LysE family transporter [Dongiaceae bacterium]
MNIELFLKGFIVGIAIAAPVGPIGLLCIQRALAGGWISGLISGLGAALADTIYGSIAAFGLTLVQDFLYDHRDAISIAGGALLCLLGLRIMLARPSPAPAEPRKSAAGLAGELCGTFMLTLANPLTILSFIAIFAALNTSAASTSYLAAATLVLGVFGGSAAWWLCLSFGIGVIRHRMDEPILRWTARVSGALVVVFGATALWHGMRG